MPALLALGALSAVAKEPEVRTELVTLALEQPVEGLYARSAGGNLRLDANLTGLSQPVAYRGPQRIVFHRTAAALTAPPPGPTPACVVLLPAHAERVLLACFQGADPNLRIVAYDLSAKTLHDGDYHFFNFSHSALSIILGTQKFTLNPTADAVLSDALWRKEVLDVEMRAATVVAGKTTQIYASVWGHRPGARNLVFLFDGQHRDKPIAIRRFKDIAPVRAPATR